VSFLRILIAELSISDEIILRQVIEDPQTAMQNVTEMAFLRFAGESSQPSITPKECKIKLRGTESWFHRSEFNAKKVIDQIKAQDKPIELIWRLAISGASDLLFDDKFNVIHCRLTDSKPIDGIGIFSVSLDNTKYPLGEIKTLYPIGQIEILQRVSSILRIEESSANQASSSS
jgi:hypothetical protein